MTNIKITDVNDYDDVEVHGFYNEYVVYRDGVYPSGILVTGLVPSNSEKQAAAYLGVPLVKVNKYNSTVDKNSIHGREDIRSDFSDEIDEFVDFVKHGDRTVNLENSGFENYPSMMEDSLYDQEELQIEEDEKPTLTSIVD